MVCFHNNASPSGSCETVSGQNNSYLKSKGKSPDNQKFFFYEWGLGGIYIRWAGVESVEMEMELGGG